MAGIQLAAATNSLSNVTAAILAGGLGTRLRPLFPDRPKALSEVKGRPFLAYLLDQLSAVGLRKVVMCTGHLGEQIQAAFGDSYGDMRLLYSRELSPVGTAGALRLALSLFDSEFILVMNGDSFCHIDLRDLFAWHVEQRAKATLVLVKAEEPARYGQVQVDADGVVIGFEEKSARSDPGWINAGVYLLARSLIKAMPEKRVVSLEREAFPAWIGKGFYGYRSSGRFLDIGTPEAYAAAGRFFV